jgi:hypothetical protein
LGQYPKQASLKRGNPPDLPSGISPEKLSIGVLPPIAGQNG